MKHRALAFCLWLGVCLGCNQPAPEVVTEQPTSIEPAPPEVVTEQPTSIELAPPEVVTDIEVYNNFSGKNAGQEWEGNGLKMKFCWCPAGKFTMGSPTTEKDRVDEREAQVKVTLTRGYWLGKYEVTQGEWERLMGTKPWSGKANVKEGPSYAASCVSWEDGVEYCKKLTTQERQAGRLPSGWEYRLPTEAQWEYACRAGTTTAYSFGNDATQLSDYAWWGGLYGDGNAKDEHYAHEVGRKRSNAWGLHDLHGNVGEWCQDWYGDKLPGGTDPVGVATGSGRVFRGGGWNNSGGLCRSADRVRNTPDDRYDDRGFRVALVPSGK